ncbi:MAG: ATP-binding protein, partial [Cetobacterium sp.]|uniref:sensor histidine kinase n=1 Tax=Cetobacterium sp. TaxID=2071632 RepID=UPI002FC74DCC
YVLFPKEWLEIIISNILDNAIKYSAENKNVNINLDIIHNTLIIEVQDFGIGIKKEDFSKIFERFYRGDKSHSSTIEGTGLGLSIVKHMIDIIEGEITVRSKTNEGTTFSIYIPIIEKILEETD